MAQARNFTGIPSRPSSAMDTVFRDGSADVISLCSPAVRASPSLAPSPILRVMLQRQGVEKHGSESGAGDRPAATPAVAASHLALGRRGVGPKDPLLRRALRQTSTPAAVHHWTTSALSEMTAARWAVFREEVGIELEPVIRSRAGTTVAPAVEALRGSVQHVCPWRCWEEAEGLPHALGCVVAKRYSLPTAIQAQAIPLALHRHAANGSPVDILGVAETGSGKTTAYLLPLLVDVLRHRPKLLGNTELMAYGPFAVVLVPTRELAEQVVLETQALLGKSSPQLATWEAEEVGCLSPTEQETYRKTHNLLSELRVVKVVGGEGIQAQTEALSHGAHIVVGTIGQLRSLLSDRHLSMGNTSLVVIDEADRVIEEQQEEALMEVLEKCPASRQTLLFTATWSAACANLARQYLNPAGYILVRTPQRCASIRQSFEVVACDDEEDSAEDAKGEGEESANNTATNSSPGRKRGRNAASATDEDGVASSPRINPLIHRAKFQRLITWLVYAESPIIVFANERQTCDALQEEMQREAARLRHLLEEGGDVDSLVGEAPKGLYFAETWEDDARARQRARRLPTLDNLTSVAVVHASMSQAERARLVRSFASGGRRVLLTTDLLARGLDVSGVRVVINYDLPWVLRLSASSTIAAEEALARYVHRIGRTGRAGATGVAVSFVALEGTRLHEAESQRTVVKEQLDSRNTEQRWLPPGADSAEDRRRRLELEDLTQAKSVCERWHQVGVTGDSRSIAKDDDDDDEDEDEDGEATPSHGHAKNGSKQRFESDELLLPALWDFLVRCTASNGCVNAADALAKQSYPKVLLPQELALIMSAPSAQHGSITQ